MKEKERLKKEYLKTSTKTTTQQSTITAQRIIELCWNFVHPRVRRQVIDKNAALCVCKRKNGLEIDCLHHGQWRVVLRINVAAVLAVFASKFRIWSRNCDYIINSTIIHFLWLFHRMIDCFFIDTFLPLRRAKTIQCWRPWHTATENNNQTRSINTTSTQ